MSSVSDGSSSRQVPAYIYEYSNSDLDGNLTAWTQWEEFPHLISIITLDGLGFLLATLVFFLSACGKSLRCAPHGWLILSSVLAMVIYSALDLTSTLGRHEITPSWTDIPWLCEVISGFYTTSVFAMFVFVTLTSLERVISIQREVYPISGFSVSATRILLLLSWLFAVGYGAYLTFFTITWTEQRDINICVNIVSKYPSLVQFLIYVVCLLAVLGGILTLLMWLYSEEVKIEAKVAARAATLSCIFTAVIFFILSSPTMILDLKRYGDIYGDDMLQKVAFYCLRLVPVLLPVTWMIGDPDVQAALCCRSSSGPDENTFLLERMSATGTQPQQ